jgi:cytoskeletal protein CcmA (bactofilin family)
MFGKAKSNLHENGELPPAPQLQNLAAVIENARSLKELPQCNTDLTHSETEQLTQQAATSEIFPVTKHDPRLAESDKSKISCIGSEMIVVGKISTEGTLDVFGRVEGELHASTVRICNGAQVEGTITAQDLTVGGRFKGTIQANRVTLTSSAVVEGEIHHRSLVIEENVWFAGAACPQEAVASEMTDTWSPIQLAATEENRQADTSRKEAPIDTAA